VTVELDIDEAGPSSEVDLSDDGGGHKDPEGLDINLGSVGDECTSETDACSAIAAEDQGDDDEAKPKKKSKKLRRLERIAGVNETEQRI